MRKIIFIFFVCFIVVGFTSVLAVSQIDEEELVQSQGITEESFPIRDDDGILIGLDCFITIPSDYHQDKLIIQPDIFGGIREYKNLHKQDEITVNLIIMNHSNYSYHYVLDSLYLETDSFNQEYEFTKSIGFDGKNIMNEFALYRTFNEAICELFHYSNYHDYKDIDLSDENLDLKLKELGYSGIDELNEYYLDFYNKKYSLQEEALSHLSKDVLKGIFEGELSFQKETNLKVIALGYENFYRNILLFHFLGEDNYQSVANYMENRNDSYLMDNGYLPRGGKLNLGMSLKIDSNSYTDVYNTYQYYGKFGFQMVKSATLDKEFIVSPKTGI